MRSRTKVNFNPFRKPEYVFQPSQCLRRIVRAFAGETPDTAETVLPWGLKIRYCPREMIGASVWRMGIYDLGLSEVIARLLDPGENAFDVGANIGHMTSIMASRVGRSGTVTAFEPHPAVFAKLLENVQNWSKAKESGTITAFQQAVSRSAGRAGLGVPAHFESNHGTSSLAAEKSITSVEVETVCLDDIVPPDITIDLMKVDVEGHELAVLEGASELFARRQIRDLVFEEHQPYPTPVTQLLTLHGFEIFRIRKGFLGPHVVPAAADIATKEELQEAPSFLATLDTGRATSRFKKRGWEVLRQPGSGQLPA